MDVSLLSEYVWFEGGSKKQKKAAKKVWNKGGYFMSKHLELLNKAAELQKEFETFFSADIPWDDPTEEEAKTHEAVGTAVKEHMDGIMNQYSVWLAAIEDHQPKKEMSMGM